MLKILKTLKPYWWQLLILVVLVYISVDTTLRLPDYMAKIINDGIVNKDNGVITRNGILMLAVSLIGAACTVGVGYLASRIATGFSMDLRNKVFAKVEGFSLVEFNKFSTASLITRSTNDIQQIQMVLILLLRMVLQAPIMGVWAVIKAYNMAPSMTWILALAVAVLMTIIIVLFSVALPKFKLLQKLVDKLNLVTRQILNGLRVIRAFNNQEFEEKKFDAANVDLTGANLFVNRLMVIMQPVMMLILNLTAITVIWVGSHLINTDNLQIGNMIAFMQYGMQVIFAFLMVSIIFIMIPRASVSAERVLEVLETEPVIKNPKESKQAGESRGLVEFKDMSFAYTGADHNVLDNITFSACPGETTAIIGSTGSGKSTLVNLIPRFYDISSGQLLIDGVDVHEYKLEDLYAKIGYVPQKGVLFSGSVESNIKYGAPDASEAEVKKAARISQAEEFVDQLEGKFAAPIAQGGANVSGGQKQRLSIARAIARKPEIYIFDDSFSALDFKTDAALRKALEEETKNKTVIIVAQRISTILNADKIVVLDEGRIVGMGGHEELMKSNKVYQEIAYSQLSEEELASYQINVDEQKARLEAEAGLVGGGAA